jgi:hypothetical protein
MTGIDRGFRREDEKGPPQLAEARYMPKIFSAGRELSECF